LQGVADPIDHGVQQYIQEKGLQAHEDELLEIALILRNIAIGDTPNFGPHSLGYIEYCLSREITPIGQQMLEEQFKIVMEPPVNKLFESGMG
jgi:hypothetical protein